MPRGNIVETKSPPNYKTVEQYRQYLRREAPNHKIANALFDPDIKCTCCTQEAPSEAAAMLKVEDETPFVKKFGVQDFTPDGTQGEIVWICADCYTNGVRPKHVYMGSIKWNKQGRRIKKRAEKHPGHPW